MKKITNLLLSSMLCLSIGVSMQASAVSINQTDTVSPVFPAQSVPFDVEIELADFQLPNGIQSFVHAIHDDKWLILGGRTNGMHTFNDNSDNFPPAAQNLLVYVVDLKTKTTVTKSLADPTSGLTQAQIDSLSTTAAQWFYNHKTLYITGGYGFDTALQNYTTFDNLTAIDVRGLMHWVTNPRPGETASQHIRQISNPIFRVTGGEMYQTPNGPVVLVFGQDFEGPYFHFTFDGIYTEQVRRFHIIDNGKKLSFKSLPALPLIKDPNYRRRDLNVVPVTRVIDGHIRSQYVAFSGVFTLAGGAWTVPVEITGNGVPFMADPTNPSTFKQGMSNYACAHMELFSKKHGDSYTVFFGGISYETFGSNGVVTDIELPFTNIVSTIKIDKCGVFTQYALNGTYPVILSTQSNPGNQLLFGASADFFPVENLPLRANGVIKYDSIRHHRTLVGRIVGGIQSTVPNTETASDSAASPYIFNVYLVPNKDFQD